MDRKRQLRGSIEPTTLCDEMTIAALLDLSKECVSILTSTMLSVFCSGHVSETTFDKYAKHWIRGTNVEWQPAHNEQTKAAL